jgi:hypothetical protein
MKRSIHSAGLTALAATTMLVACSGGGGGNGPAQRQPGMWETKAKVTQLQITGAPPEMQARANAQIGQERTSSECLTAEQARDPLAQMRQMMSQQGATANCRFSDQVFAGGTIRIRASCPAAGGGSADIAVEGTFTETTMTATMTMNAQGPADPSAGGATGMRMTAETSGRRTGDCPGSGTAG